MAKHGYLAMIKGSNSSASRTTVGGVALIANCAMSFEPHPLQSEREEGGVAVFATAEDALDAARAACWNNQRAFAEPYWPSRAKYPLAFDMP